MSEIKIYRTSEISDHVIDDLVSSLRLQHSVPYSYNKVREVSILYAYPPVNNIALLERYQSLEKRHSVSRYMDGFIHTMLYTSNRNTICGIAHPPFVYVISNHICCLCIGYTVDSVNDVDMRSAFTLLRNDAVDTLDGLHDISGDDSPVEYVIPYLIPSIDESVQINLLHELFGDLNVIFHIFQLTPPL